MTLVSANLKAFIHLTSMERKQKGAYIKIATSLL